MSTTTGDVTARGGRQGGASGSNPPPLKRRKGSTGGDGSDDPSVPEPSPTPPKKRKNTTKLKVEKKPRLEKDPKVDDRPSTAYTVTKKLNQFSKVQAVTVTIGVLALLLTEVAALAYAFGNFYILRQLHRADGGVMPPIDDAFYRRCIQCVTTSTYDDASLSSEFAWTRELFAAFSPTNASKPDIRGPAAKIMADLLAGRMATCSQQNISRNLRSHLSQFLALLYPGSTKTQRSRVVNAVSNTRQLSTGLDSLFPRHAGELGATEARRWCGSVHKIAGTRVSTRTTAEPVMVASTAVVRVKTRVQQRHTQQLVQGWRERTRRYNRPSYKRIILRTPGHTPYNLNRLSWS